MEFHQVRYFVSLAKTLNFTRAAEECAVSQPALTKGVQKLEQELGSPLIYRERQLTHLTDLGKEVLPMFEAIVAAESAVQNRAREYKGSEFASLKVGLVPSISASLLVGPLHGVSKQLPSVRVELIEARCERLLEMLLSGEVHAAMVGDLEVKPSRIDEWILFEERYVAVLPATHHLADKQALTSADLQTTTILCGPDCDTAHKTPRSMRERAPSSHRSEQESHLQHMAAAGFGIVLAPEHMPRVAPLVSVPLEKDPITRQVRLLVVQGRQYSPALDAFVKIMRMRDWTFANAGKGQMHILTELESFDYGVKQHAT
jgi:DNA-binding transcriptional LysR family regulator